MGRLLSPTWLLPFITTQILTMPRLARCHKVAGWFRLCDLNEVTGVHYIRVGMVVGM